MEWKQDDVRSGALRVALWSVVGFAVVVWAMPRGRGGDAGPFLATVICLSPIWGWGFYQVRLARSRRRLGATPPPGLQIRAALAALRCVARGLLVCILCATAWAVSFPIFEPDFVHSPEGVALWLGLTLTMFASLAITAMALLLHQAHLLEGLAVSLAAPQNEPGPPRHD